jgi:hypothetical protein
MFWTIISIYALVFIFIPIWDTFVGFKENDGTNVMWGANDNPPIIVLMGLWPIFLPFIIIDTVFGKLNAIKKKRIEKEVRATNIRIAAENEQRRLEQEQEMAIRQIDEELRRENLSNKRSF